jgi:hypothetical protein
MFVSSSPEFCPIIKYFVSFIEKSGVTVELGERVSAAQELRDEATPDFDGFLKVPDSSLIEKGYYTIHI